MADAASRPERVLRLEVSATSAGVSLESVWSKDSTGVPEGAAAYGHIPSVKQEFSLQW